MIDGINLKLGLSTDIRKYSWILWDF